MRTINTIFGEYEVLTYTGGFHHVDIITCHICNTHCPNCVDRFLNSSKEFISNETVEKFLRLIRKHTDKMLSALLLGGEPTMLPSRKLISLAETIRGMNFRVLMSTNGILKDKIIYLLPYIDSVQLTVGIDDEKTLNFWKEYSHKINIKVAIDLRTNIDNLQRWIRNTKGFYRRSVSVYFTPDWRECCADKHVQRYLDSLWWEREGNYLYAFKDGVRYKRCIPGASNVEDTPMIPKVYPNGNYNKTWTHERLDDYLDGNW